MQVVADPVSLAAKAIPGYVLEAVVEAADEPVDLEVPRKELVSLPASTNEKSMAMAFGSRAIKGSGATKFERSEPHSSYRF